MHLCYFLFFQLITDVAKDLDLTLQDLSPDEEIFDQPTPSTNSNITNHSIETKSINSIDTNFDSNNNSDSLKINNNNNYIASTKRNDDDSKKKKSSSKLNVNNVFGNIGNDTPSTATQPSSSIFDASTPPSPQSSSSIASITQSKSSSTACDTVTANQTDTFKNQSSTTTATTASIDILERENTREYGNNKRNNFSNNDNQRCWHQEQFDHIVSHQQQQKQLLSEPPSPPSPFSNRYEQNRLSPPEQFCNQQQRISNGRNGYQIFGQKQQQRVSCQHSDKYQFDSQSDSSEWCTAAATNENANDSIADGTAKISPILIKQPDTIITNTTTTSSSSNSSTTIGAKLSSAIDSYRSVQSSQFNRDNYRTPTTTTAATSINTARQEFPSSIAHQNSSANTKIQLIQCKCHFPFDCSLVCLIFVFRSWFLNESFSCHIILLFCNQIDLFLFSFVTYLDGCLFCCATCYCCYLLFHFSVNLFIVACFISSVSRSVLHKIYIFLLVVFLYYFKC